MRSSERARELGEVFTPSELVADLLDLVGDISYSSNFLEPGCGSGNFLIQILERKLNQVANLPEVKQGLKAGIRSEFETKSLMALSSVYGVDISPINIEESRARMVDLFETKFLECSKLKELDQKIRKAAEVIISQNIILGDMLNAPEKIIIYEYAELPNHKVKIRAFEYADLMFPESEVFDDTPQLFGHVPQPVKEYQTIPIRELGALDG